MPEVTLVISLNVHDASPESFERIKDGVAAHVQSLGKDPKVQMLVPFQPPPKTPWVRVLEATLESHPTNELTGAQVADLMHIPSPQSHNFRLISEGMRQLGWSSRRTAAGQLYLRPGFTRTKTIHRCDSIPVETIVAGAEFLLRGTASKATVKWWPHWVLNAQSKGRDLLKEVEVFCAANADTIEDPKPVLALVRDHLDQGTKRVLHPDAERVQAWLSGPAASRQEVTGDEVLDILQLRGERQPWHSVAAGGLMEKLGWGYADTETGRVYLRPQT